MRGQKREGGNLGTGKGMSQGDGTIENQLENIASLINLT